MWFGPSRPYTTATPASGFTPAAGFSLSTPGGISDGQLMTLNGSGFGSIGPQLLFYKNFANETVGTRVSNAPDFAIAGLSYAGNGNGFPYVISGNGLPYGRAMIISNDSRVGNESTGAGWGGMVLTFPSQISEFFTTGTLYFPSSCNYTPIINSAGNPQIKIDWVFANKPGGGGFNDTDIYNGCDGANISLAYVFQSNAAPGLASNLVVGSNTQWVWGPGPYPKTDVPIRNSRWVQLNAPPGSGTGNILWLGVWDGSTNSIYAYNNNLVLVAGTSSFNGYGIMSAPGFVQNGGTNPQWSVSGNAYAAQGEIYVAGPSTATQGAAARIEIGDSANYNTCSRLSTCTVESPSWWSGTSVQFRLRLGTFYQSISGCHLFITDFNNTTTHAGVFS